MDETDFAALLAFAIVHGLALFPIPLGRKAPVGIVNSFAEDWSRESEQWNRWRAENPGCNFGVVCGPSGLIIVDVDLKAGVAQWETFAQWWRENVGGEPPEPTVRSPSGGLHVYFYASLPEGMKLHSPDLANGVETKAGNGYVVAPLSRTERARDSQVKADGQYVLLRDDIDAAPAALFEHCTLVNKPNRIVSRKLPLAYDGYPVGRGERDFVQNRVNNAIDMLRSAPHGSRNNTLFRASVMIGVHIADGAIDTDIAEELLTEAAVEIDLEESEIEPTILSGFNHGAEDGAALGANPAIAFQHVQKIAPPLLSASPDPGLWILEQSRLQIRATPYPWTNPRDIPPRQFLYGRHLARGFVSATVATGGVGKTALKIAEALAMASGRDLLAIGGTWPPLRVWYWNLEDPRDELTRRIQATAMHHGLDQADIHDRLFIDSGREQELVIAESTRNGTAVVRAVVDSLIEELKAKRIDVIIVDPFVSCHRVIENDNNAIDRVVKEWGRVAHEANCAVELVHHTRKPSNGESEATTDSARGAKALTDACRSVVTINRMTPRDGEDAGVQNHRFYFRTVNDKNNLAPPPPPQASVWYKFESVALENAQYFGDVGDNVGVVVRWKWPDASALVSTGDLRRVQERVAAGKWRKDPQATDWVGRAVAEVLGLDRKSKSDRARIRELLKGWIDTGRLKIVDGLDGNRQRREFVEVGMWEQEIPATPQGAPP
jgi:hypothetical protein